MEQCRLFLEVALLMILTKVDPVESEADVDDGSVTGNRMAVS